MAVGSSHCPKLQGSLPQIPVEPGGHSLTVRLPPNSGSEKWI
jgi:hypothetical protein